MTSEKVLSKEQDPNQFRLVNEEVLEILDGAIDTHVHPGPSPFPRRIGIADAAIQAHSAGFKAIIVKSHHHSMVTDILAIKDSCPDSLPIPVYSGIALNDQIGGLNPYAVEMSLKMGGRIVWFPTMSSLAHIESHKHGGTHGFPTSTIQLRPNKAIEITNDDGSPKDEVLDILEVIAEQDAIVTGGHLGADAIDILLKTAQRTGVKRMLVNHPNFVIGASPERCKEWVALGAYVEHSICMYDPGISTHQFEIPSLVEYIRAVGPERTILASDLGQKQNPLPIESYERVIKALLDASISKKEIRQMTVDAPTRLLL